MIRVIANEGTLLGVRLSAYQKLSSLVSSGASEYHVSFGWA